MGRHKKVGAKVSGQLNSNECRVSFICDKELAQVLRATCKAEKITLKAYMHSLITKAIKKNAVKEKAAKIQDVILERKTILKDEKQNGLTRNKIPKTNNEKLLIRYQDSPKETE